MAEEEGKPLQAWLQTAIKDLARRGATPATDAEVIRTALHRLAERPANLLFFVRNLFRK